MIKAISSSVRGVKANVAIARIVPSQICMSPNSTSVPVIAPRAKFAARTNDIFLAAEKYRGSRFLFHRYSIIPIATE